MRLHPILTNFTAGEFSPLLYGRVDFKQYPLGCQKLLNMTIWPHGPAERRPGTRFVAEVKDSSKKVRLVPFEFNVEQAYILEFGDSYIRFYKDGGRIESPPGTPVEIATTYQEGQLAQLRWAQIGDVLYLAHPDHPVRKLTRTSHTAWTLREVAWMPPATVETGFAPDTTLTLSAATGLGVTMTAGTGTFLDGDIGREVRVGNGRAVIRTVAANPAPQVTCTADVLDDFAGVGPHASGTWRIHGSPNDTCTPGAESPVNSIVTLTLAGKNGWRADNVGRYVRINKGVIRLTKYTSGTVMEGQILSILANKTGSPGGAWSLEDPAWGGTLPATTGYPRAISFFESRLYLGRGQTFWGSAPGDFENFGIGPDDDDAVEFVIAANDVNTLQWFVPTKVLLIGTASAEFRASGGTSEAPITPSSIAVKSDSAWGSGTVAPLRVGNAALFATRSGTALRELIYSFERDSYVANDMLLLSEHLTRKGRIIELAYQRTPHSLVWAIREDGVILPLTYQREHDVVGWSRVLTGPDQPADGTPVKGKFESVAVIPHWAGNRDVAWTIVRRTIGGQSKRFVEYFDEGGGFYGRLQVDSALVYSGASTSTLAGLAHLEGETVQILGDGAVYPEAVVTGGAVTVSPAVTSAEVGLRFDSALTPMRVETGLATGTSQGRQKRWAEIFVRLDRTLGCDINGIRLPFRSAQDPMDSPPPILTGDRKVVGTGRDRDGLITIEQKLPLPLTVIGIFGTLGVGD